MSEVWHRIRGTSPEDARPTSPVTHLVVMQHGLHGYPSQMRSLKDAILLASKDAGVWVVRSNQSEHFFMTHSGVDVLGDHLYKFICEKAREAGWTELRGPNDPPRRLSIVGHSLGGITARFALGLMHASNWFADHDASPHAYISCASPHVGVSVEAAIKALRIDGIRILPTLWPAVVASAGAVSRFCSAAYGATGQHLFLRDEGTLLVRMSQPDSDYIKGLAVFPQRILIINEANDPQVLPFTSGIRMPSPGEQQHYEASDPVAWAAMKTILDNFDASGLEWKRFSFTFPSVDAHNLALYSTQSAQVILEVLLESS